MRHITLALTISMLWVGATLRAADIPATQPDAPPPAELVKVPTPSTAPAVEQSPAPARVEAGSILVLPFAQTMGANYPWMSLALQQDLQLELSRSSRAKVEAPSAMVATADKNAAVKAGLDSHATLVVYGQYQVTGDQIHISGSVIDVATAKPTGVFAATGSVNNVFPLEDSIAGQVLRELPAGWTTVALPPVNGSGEASGEPAIQPNSPPTVPTIRYYSYTYPTYTAPPPAYPYYYYDPYPYNWYTVPYYGPDIFLFGGWGFYSHHYWDHHWGGFHDHGGGGHVGGGHVGGGGGTGHR